ncbi:hypothetical protein C477_04474 [Haloterrigena salina JCM 13891]|uniref:Uncharacterized protein n=1 Tax=Haloterrigena salina JCM 13891 TaxID=1227488 RepID=M0CFD4_9EURY|nr:hypothetical protein [Haloterrigena salina]ELZ21970.1 hypothetical protein C477_04474 [Haloterrigena salina JCM 13891]
MEDYDWIQIAFLFDRELSHETYESLFDLFLEYSETDDNRDELDDRYGDETNGSQRVRADASEIARTVRSVSSVKVSVPVGWDDISIGFSRNGSGFPTYGSTPYLTFTTWIYALKDSDREPLERVKRRRREFVEILARAANVLEPRWGFGRRGGLAIGEDDTIDDLAARLAPPLYEYNVFRPETVETLGRERVRSAPAWFVEELDSGGAFLAVREPPRQCSPAAEPCLEVADHLGISVGKTDRYH